MALIDCPECGKRVSDRAVACPQCAYPVGQSLAQQKPAPAIENDKEFAFTPVETNRGEFCVYCERTTIRKKIDGIIICEICGRDNAVALMDKKSLKKKRIKKNVRYICITMISIIFIIGLIRGNPVAINGFMHATVYLVFAGIFYGIIRIVTGMVPDKYRDGVIAPKKNPWET